MAALEARVAELERDLLTLLGSVNVLAQNLNTLAAANALTADRVDGIEDKHGTLRARVKRMAGLLLGNGKHRARTDR